MLSENIPTIYFFDNVELKGNTVMAFKTLVGKIAYQRFKKRLSFRKKNEVQCVLCWLVCFCNPEHMLLCCRRCRLLFPHLPNQSVSKLFESVHVFNISHFSAVLLCG